MSKWQSRKNSTPKTQEDYTIWVVTEENPYGFESVAFWCQTTGEFMLDQTGTSYSDYQMEVTHFAPIPKLGKPE